MPGHEEERVRTLRYIKVSITCMLGPLTLSKSRSSYCRDRWGVRCQWCPWLLSHWRSLCDVVEVRRALQRQLLVQSGQFREP